MDLLWPDRTLLDDRPPPGHPQAMEGPRPRVDRTRMQGNQNLYTCRVSWGGMVLSPTININYVQRCGECSCISGINKAKNRRAGELGTLGGKTKISGCTNSRKNKCRARLGCNPLKHGQCWAHLRGFLCNLTLLSIKVCTNDGQHQTGLQQHTERCCGKECGK